MKALITGASSGLGREFAYILSDMGYDLVLVARRKTRLENLKKDLKTNVDIMVMDLASTFNCVKLHNDLKKADIDIVINNAGFGIVGDFTKTKLEKEMDMIDLNIKAVHTLTKLFLTDMKKKDKGYILNVASSASFTPGPLMSTYYATKSYVYNLTLGIYEELRKENSRVYIGCLCPGPVNTEFNKVAKVDFSVKALEADKVAKYAIKKMFKGKNVIIPGMTMNFTKFITKILPVKWILPVVYKIQKEKTR